VTFAPVTAALRVPGGPGAQPPDPLLIVISLEGALVPAVFLARIRTKYVPFGIPGAMNVVAVLKVSKATTFVAPLVVPASTT
jgi:hypothetical protein